MTCSNLYSPLLFSTCSPLSSYPGLPSVPSEEERFVVRSPYSDVQLPEANLADYVWKDVEKWPENPALVRELGIKIHEDKCMNV